jgi:hypothetical protein
LASSGPKVRIWRPEWPSRLSRSLKTEELEKLALFTDRACFRLQQSIGVPSMAPLCNTKWDESLLGIF